MLELREKSRASESPKPLKIKDGTEGIRTLDLCVANAALSQLSYEPSSELTSLLRDFMIVSELN